MHRSILYRDGQVLELDSIEAVRTALGDQQGFLWVDVRGTDAEDFALLREDFRFHPMAVEDALRQEGRAKLETYPDYTLIVLLDLGLDQGLDRVHVRQVTIFVGPTYMVTVHEHPIESLNALWHQLLDEPGTLESHPRSQLVHLIADGLVDAYFPIVDQFDDRLEELEEGLFNSHGRVSLARLFALRKVLISLRRLVNQMRDVFNILSHQEQMLFHESSLPYLTDVYDHLLRISDTLELQRDLLSGALESYLSIQSNELNVTVRKLTAVTVVFMVPTLIAGIYGMNFQNMPELGWPLGYPLALVIMGLSSVGLYLYLRRIGWF